MGRVCSDFLHQATTGLTPFQCILSYQPPLFPWSGEPSDFPAIHHWFQESERVWDSDHIHLQRAVQRHKKRTWVTHDDILDPSLLLEFHTNHPVRPAPRGRGCSCRCPPWSSGAARGQGEGVLSQSQQHPQHQTRTLRPLIPSLLNSDHLHLSLPITTPYLTCSLQFTIVWSCCSF